ncbi:hypothetical protein E2C01_041871 [Portunus trituberculatus]|uniref:Uncharacterized protein n=1 Tax=Portunus trituberculatus TaxID=210409 RepID=A0A5B7FRJ0_PORTR|nr:hypothetical protein [Portunus trituberculatus]
MGLELPGAPMGGRGPPREPRLPVREPRPPPRLPPKDKVAPPREEGSEVWGGEEAPPMASETSDYLRPDTCPLATFSLTRTIS